MTRREEIQWEAGGIVNRMIHRGFSEHYDTYYQAFQDGATWADKTMIDKACEWAKKRFDLDYCSNVKELLDYLKSLVEE